MSNIATKRGWFRRWVWSGLSVLGAVAALVGPTVSGTVGEPERFLWLAVGIVGAILATIPALLEKRTAERRITSLQGQVVDAKKQGRKDLLVIIDWALTPLVEQLGRLVRTTPSSHRRQLLASDFQTQALNTLKEVIDPSIPQLRANYFKLQYDANDNPILVAVKSTAKPTRQSFRTGTAEGDAVMDMLAGAETVFCRDTAVDAPPGFDASRVRDYKTFISATAFDGIEPDGMLTVDAPKSGTLTGADKGLVRLVAALVAISESIRDRKKEVSM